MSVSRLWELMPMGVFFAWQDASAILLVEGPEVKCLAFLDKKEKMIWNQK